jgi:A/G-specific adenine glycosylase
VDRPRTQAKYEGSDRQERGRILRELRSSDVALPIKQLRKSAKNEQQFDRALQSLIKEELIIDVPRGRVSLPES